MEISCNKTKVRTMEGKSMKKANIAKERKNAQQVIALEYVGCNITNFKTNLYSDENIQKYNRTICKKYD